ncbi:hypothetical protein PT974_11658 [Cladobotryum mycophilum]|uniref:Uncharacterized protein n=1 Tax=Cladobotryum mycophilum TaxID=491253 RepID=A0ABR0S6S8_9HYPO
MPKHSRCDSVQLAFVSSAVGGHGGWADQLADDGVPVIASPGYEFPRGKTW